MEQYPPKAGLPKNPHVPLQIAEAITGTFCSPRDSEMLATEPTTDETVPFDPTAAASSGALDVALAATLPEFADGNKTGTGTAVN